jgi:hypothetical protein
MEKLLHAKGQLETVPANVGARPTMPAHNLIPEALGPLGRSEVHLQLCYGLLRQLEILQTFYQEEDFICHILNLFALIWFVVFNGMV